LQRWFGLFGREQMLILNFDDFVARQQHLMDRCFQFLGVTPHDVEPRHTNRSPERPTMPSSAEQHLRSYFRPQNRDLYELIDRDFGWPE
jgi:hypothetical protein